MDKAIQRIHFLWLKPQGCVTYFVYILEPKDAFSIHTPLLIFVIVFIWGPFISFFYSYFVIQLVLNLVNKKYW